MDFFNTIIVYHLVVTVMSSPVYVNVNEGQLVGETVDFVEDKFVNITTRINRFQGVPYAEVPVRFQAPERKAAWEGIWNATGFRGTCIQHIDQNVFIDKLNVTEDCLYLNIYAPSDSRALPVMVYIHGGSYVTGTSMISDLSGIPMAAIGNVVVVTINYRLGILGFLNTGDDASSGNFGLLDQAEALRWIRNNIKAFGGDRKQVTIFGESAGSGSVHFHILSEYSRDLFDRAIMQSGTATVGWSFKEEHEDELAEIAFKIGMAANCDTESTHELVECLRQVDAMQLQNIAMLLGYNARATVDGVFLKDSPNKILERGDFKQCPLMIGFARDEGTINMFTPFYHLLLEDRPHINKTMFEEMLRNYLQGINQNVHVLLEDAIAQQYMDWSQAENDNFDYFDTMVKITGDKEFSCPSMEVARSHAMMTSHSTFLYYMTHVPTSTIFTAGPISPSWLGAGHAEDLRFVFGYSFIPVIDQFRGPMTDGEIELSVKFIRFWTNFAKSGDPTRSDPSSPPGEGEWAWPAFTIPELQYKELSLDLPVGRGLKADECAFWNHFKPKLEQYLASFEQTEKNWRDDFSDWQDDLQEWRLAFKKFQDQNSCN